jgi:hypothetical protein
MRFSSSVLPARNANSETTSRYSFDNNRDRRRRRPPRRRSRLRRLGSTAALRITDPVLPAWATAVLTLTGVVIGALIALVTNERQLRHSKEEREANEITALREKGAAIIGPLLGLLSDADPDRMAINAGPQTPELMRQYLERWNGLRDQLSIYGALHPAHGVSVLTTRLVAAGWNSLTSTGWLVRDVPTSFTLEQREKAKEDHELALEVAHQLRKTMRSYPDHEAEAVKAERA